MHVACPQSDGTFFISCLTSSKQATKPFNLKVNCKCPRATNKNLQHTLTLGAKYDHTACDGSCETWPLNYIASVAPWTDV